MKIGVPCPVEKDRQGRIYDSLLLWEDRSSLLICLAEPSRPWVYKYDTALMPRNTSELGSKQPRVYVRDVLKELLKYDEDWYGLCNSDCVPSNNLTEGNEDFEVLIYHRTDIPDWKDRFNIGQNTSEDVIDRIIEMRNEGITNKKIARKLNRMEIPPPKGKEWTYVNVKELFFEQGTVYFWGQDMFLFRKDVMQKIVDELPHDFVFGTGGYDQRLAKWCSDNFKTVRVINKLFHVAHTSEWSADDVEYLHNGGDLEINERQKYVEETFLLGLSDQGSGGDSVSTFIKNWTPHIVENPLSFITTEKMITATHLMASFLPYNIDLIVGIARSGLIPASVLSCHLHLPLMAVSENGVADVGSGTRFKDKADTYKNILIVDDTVFAGRTMQKVFPIIKQTFPRSEIFKSAIYSTPQAKHLVDYFACELAEPHYLEWNFFNSGPGERALYDMDGILCRDIAPENDDDGPRYIRALRDAVPKYLPRRRVISKIVTARLERYRGVTEEWLDKHRIQCNELIMGPWRTLQERNQSNTVATFKSKIFAKSGEVLFVESCPIQAREIAKQTGKKVLCPAAGRVFS